MRTITSILGLLFLCITMVTAQSNKSILVSPNIGQVAEITNSEADEIHPAVSPDGKYVAYAKFTHSSGFGSYDIMIKDASGGAMERIVVSSKDEETDPAWFPDGKYILCTIKRSDRTILGKFSVEGQSAIGELTTSGYFTNGRVAKNNRIIFVESSMKIKNPATGNMDISEPYIKMMDSDGRNVTNLIAGQDPAISPDGRKMAFARRIDNHWRIYIMDLDTGELSQLQTGAENLGADDRWPSWSPSGRYLVFQSNRNKVHKYKELWKPWKIFKVIFGERQWDLYRIKADGSGLTRLTQDERNEIRPSWGRGGNIFFQSDLKGNWDIYVLKLRR